MKKFTMAMVAAWLVAAVSFAQDVRVLSLNEAVAWGATHVVVLEHDDLTTTTTNTAQTFSVAVLAKQGAEVVCSVLETAFVDSATNANNSLTLTVGDGSDADLFLASQQLCSDGTEVFLQYGGNMFNSGTTNNVTLVARQKVYTADGNVVLTVTPHASYGVAAMDAGKVRVYLRITDSVARLR